MAFGAAADFHSAALRASEDFFALEGLQSTVSIESELQLYPSFPDDSIFVVTPDQSDFTIALIGEFRLIDVTMVDVTLIKEPFNVSSC